MQKRFKYRILIRLMLVISTTPLFAQISPGELAEPHAHLKGLSNCTKCHTMGEKISNDKCLNCHLDIAIRVEEQRGYHASVEVKGKNCITCHSDHHGKKFQMIRFNSDEFDHLLTGYNLHGAHAETDCKQCHNAQFITDPKLKAKSSTYLGLDQKCLSCHSDYHQGTLSSDCASCHDFSRFKPASKFNHTRAHFNLQGKHLGVDCKACHPVVLQYGKEMQKFTGIPFDECTSCHKDVHNNKFGQNCLQCHSVNSFHQIKGIKNFNHSRTNYPLKGSHRSVSCASCHKSGYTRAIPYARCSDCHTDYHHNQFAKKGGSPDCSECHTLQGFNQSTFTIERHNSSKFQLSGAHLATPCFACHKRSEKWSFREVGEKCVDCHKNIHEPYLDKKYYPEANCVNCHNSFRWNEISFNHDKTDFQLEGAHLRQTCRSCHFQKSPDGKTHQQFSQLSSSCMNCHQDVHYRQFEESGGTDCLSCHDYSNWSARKFDHNQAAFKLDGKHKNVACAKCHPPVVTDQITYTQYKLKDFSCESCH